MTATGTEDYVTEYSYNDSNGKYTALLQKEVKTVEKENELDITNNVKQTVYTYDKNGNQIKKTADGKTETNTYDGLNQLIGFTNGETTASYKYNEDGLRYEKTVNDQTINHVWDSNKQIVADVIDNQFYEADCYIRGTNLAAKYNYQNGNKSEYTYYTQNAHGDVVNLTDKTGKVTKSYTYDAFGVEKNIDKNDTNAFRYCGEYYDAEMGTIYLRARYYDPSIGRFISRDSFAGIKEDPLSLNRYTYCHNNPIIYYDRNGHWVHLAIGAAIGGLISGGATILTNVIEGEKWYDGLATSLVSGAASGALTASGVGIVGQVIGGAAISAGANLAEQATDDEEFSITSLAFDTIVGGVIGKMGGKGAAAGKRGLASAEALMKKNIGRSFKNNNKYGYKAVLGGIKGAIKNDYLGNQMVKNTYSQIVPKGLRKLGSEYIKEVGVNLGTDALKQGVKNRIDYDKLDYYKKNWRRDFNRMWYSITTLSPIIVIYRQVLPNHRKISIFEGRNMENCVTTLFLKNHQNADFW